MPLSMIVFSVVYPYACSCIIFSAKHIKAHAPKRTVFIFIINFIDVLSIFFIMLFCTRVCVMSFFDFFFNILNLFKIHILIFSIGTIFLNSLDLKTLNLFSVNFLIGKLPFSFLLKFLFIIFCHYVWMCSDHYIG